MTTKDRLGAAVGYLTADPVPSSLGAKKASPGTQLPGV
jgi:hypothetical protein